MRIATLVTLCCLSCVHGGRHSTAASDDMDGDVDVGHAPRRTEKRRATKHARAEEMAVGAEKLVRDCAASGLGANVKAMLQEFRARYPEDKPDTAIALAMQRVQVDPRKLAICRFELLNAKAQILEAGDGREYGEMASDDSVDTAE